MQTGTRTWTCSSTGRTSSSCSRTTVPLGFSDASAVLANLVAEPTRSAADIDVDGDGDVDLLLERENGRMRLLLNRGNGRFGEAQQHTPVDGYVTAVTTDDLDGDGDSDVLFATDTGGALWRNDGNGQMMAESAGLSQIQGTPAIALADVDADGDLDSLWARTGQSRLFVNDGRALFADETSSRLPIEDGTTRATAFGDLNGDGDLDLLLGNFESGFGAAKPNVVTWENVGGGRFIDDSAFPGRGPTNAVALADVDLDGDLDAFVGSEAGTELRINDGTGLLSPAPTVALDVTSRTLDLAVGDLNGDGAIDAYLGHATSVSQSGHFPAPDTVAINDGSGSFDVSAPAQKANAITFDVEVADLDGDGDLDVLAKEWQRRSFNSPPPSVEALWNDGSANFTAAGESLATHALGSSLRVALADFDGDEDIDVFADGRILTNLRSALATRALPRVGKSLTLEAYGPPNAPVVLAAARATQTRPLGALGTLRIDLGTILFSIRGPLGASGSGSVSFRTPNDPTLVGTTFHWQALVGNPARLTNLETTTLTRW